MLLAGLDGVAVLPCTRRSACRAYDVHCPLGSLPLALKTDAATIPADIPYLRADAERIAKWRLGARGAARQTRCAGLGRSMLRHANDRNRSIDLALLAPLLALDGISFVSIQRELRADDEADCWRVMRM